MTLKNGRKLEVIVKSRRIEMATRSVALGADMQSSQWSPSLQASG
jgi:hypothetical protein